LTFFLQWFFFITFFFFCHKWGNPLGVKDPYTPLINLVFFSDVIFWPIPIIFVSTAFRQCSRKDAFLIKCLAIFFSILPTRHETLQKPCRFDFVDSWAVDVKFQCQVIQNSSSIYTRSIESAMPYLKGGGPLLILSFPKIKCLKQNRWSSSFL